MRLYGGLDEGVVMERIWDDGALFFMSVWIFFWIIGVWGADGIDTSGCWVWGVLPGMEPDVHSVPRVLHLRVW